MIITIHPSGAGGTATAPPSKSIAQRALAIAWQRRGRTNLVNTGYSGDEQAVLHLLRQAGCTVASSGGELVIDSTAAHPLATADFGESGLAARMLTPLLALQDQAVTVTGSGSLLHRPMTATADALARLGVEVMATDGRLPIRLKGPLQPTGLTVDGSLSSQSVTGLILAYALAGVPDVTLQVKDPVSTPYIALTLNVMEALRLPVPRHDSSYTAFTFTGEPPYRGPVRYAIEGDWSSAAFLAVAGAISGSVTIRGLDVFTAQGDKAILQPLMDAGVTMSITVEELIARRAPLKAFHFNATDHPDLFPPLAVLGAFAAGTSVIEGVHRLIHKESNRAAALQEELGKMGIDISFQEDMMLIRGGLPVRGTRVQARGDHRIAMACAVAALRADGPTTIEGAAAVAKSWPSFFTDLQELGVQLTTL